MCWLWLSFSPKIKQKNQSKAKMVETHPSRTHCELLFQVTHAYGSSVSVTACLGCPASLSLPPWHSWSATGSQRRSSTRRGQSRRTKRKHKYSRRHSLLRLARKNCQTLFSTEILQNCSKLFNLQKCYNTSSVPLKLLQWLPCLRLAISLTVFLYAQLSSSHIKWVQWLQSQVVW